MLNACCRRGGFRNKGKKVEETARRTRKFENHKGKSLVREEKKNPSAGDRGRASQGLSGRERVKMKKF